jgi:hypothetical protein
MLHSPDGVSTRVLRLPDPDTRTSVIEALLAAADRFSPGQAAFEDADLAITLALSPRRSATTAAFLMRNVKRDARRIRKRRPRVIPFSSLERDGANSDNAEDKSLEGNLPPSNCPRPDDEVAAADMQRFIRDHVAPLPYGAACFDAMLERESPDDTADRLGMPVHRVHRTRADIRRYARPLLA